MKPYPSYKNSGVECVGDIPTDWQVKRVKYLLNSYDGIKIGPFGSALKLDTLSDSGIKIYGQANIIKDDFTLGHRYLTVEQFNKNFTQYEIIDGDVLVTMMGTTGKSKVFNDAYEKGILDSHLLRLRFNKLKLSSHLFSILLQQSDYIFQQLKLSSKGSIMEGLNSSIVRELSVITPPPHEQTGVLSYLDAKTQKIDKLITLTEQKIEFLKEQRIALINHCVTKGLNPNVEMKDSGVEWIGEIPKHWSSISLRYYLTKTGSGVTPRGGGEVYSEEGVKFLRSQNIHFGGLRLDDVVFITETIHNNMKNSQIKRGDVLLNITGGSIGRCCVVGISDEMNVNQHVSILRTKESLLNHFLNYFLSSSIGQEQVVFNQTGANREGLTSENIKNFKLALPNLVEQQEIIEHLDIKTQKIESTIDKESQRIELLKEYRQSLISEVVTGKIDVRDEVIV